jgi:hypothetical protein
LYNFEDFKENKPHQRLIKVAKFKDESEKSIELEKLNPYGLSKELLSANYSMYELNSKYSLKGKEDVETVKRIIELLIERGKISIDLFNVGF